MEYLYDTFDEYAEIMNIKDHHPYYDAFVMVWRMARIPASVAEVDDE